MDLFIGRKKSGFSVVPDEKYPRMWRVRSPDGRLSDMVNLTGAKDAARSWAPQKGVHFSWKRGQKATEAPRTA